MCDEKTVSEAEDYLRRGGGVSRRQFTRLTGGAALSLLVAPPANALSVREREVEIETPDGKANAHYVHPARGEHPGVLVWPDALGLRPAFRAMGKRLAQSGYAVLTVNPHYRTMRGAPLSEGESIRDPAVMERILGHVRDLTPERTRSDAKAFIGFLDAQKTVDPKRKMGTTGYCMGGSMTFRTAALFPDRIGAGASFHGGWLATKDAESPHLLVPAMKARYLVAIAENDDESEPETKTILKDAFTKAGLPAEIEVYAGALHGWCALDSHVYDEAKADRAWTRLLALFETALA